MDMQINHRKIDRVIIDQHYKEKHPDITDEVILELVKSINEEDFAINERHEDFEYFTAEPVYIEDSPYRLVMVLCFFDNYLGIINAFRVNRSKLWVK
jgi:hypothetical protein